MPTEKRAVLRRVSTQELSLVGYNTLQRVSTSSLADFLAMFPRSSRSVNILLRDPSSEGKFLHLSGFQMQLVALSYRMTHTNPCPGFSFGIHAGDIADEDG